MEEPGHIVSPGPAETSTVPPGLEISRERSRHSASFHAGLSTIAPPALGVLGVRLASNFARRLGEQFGADSCRQSDAEKPLRALYGERHADQPRSGDCT